MVTRTVDRHLRWVAPSPLWARARPPSMPAIESVVGRPAILRFASDAFMDELMEVLAESPSRLADWVAKPETWRRPMKTAKTARQPAGESRIAYLLERTHRLAHRGVSGSDIVPAATGLPAVREEIDDLPLKLFQAAHQRFYLVSASLVADSFGFPDRNLDPVRSERVTFVVRRRVPPADFDAAADPAPDTSAWDEYAFVESGDGFAWQRLGKGDGETTRRAIAGEEQLPMFPLTFDDRCKRPRQLLSGLIPVGKREAWMGAGQRADAGVGDSGGPAAGLSPRTALFLGEVVEPWKALIERARLTREELKLGSGGFPPFDADGDRAAEEALTLRTAREQIQTVSWYVLLDFAKFLEEYLADIWEVVTGQRDEADLDDDQKVLFDVLENTTLPRELFCAIENIDCLHLPGFGDLAFFSDPTSRQGLNVINTRRTLKQALIAVHDAEEQLEAVEIAYVRGGGPFPRDASWPSLLFPLCDPDPSLPASFDEADPAAPLPALDLESVTGSTEDSLTARIDALLELVDRVLPADAGQPEPESLAAGTPVLDGREGWFVTRCIFERPRCGPLFPALVSEASQPFQLAQFFDPDAPMRPVRIPMPVDISPAGLRKYKKNASFVMSDMLCGMVSRIKKMTFADLVLSVLPWPFHKDLPDPTGAGPCKRGGLNVGIVCSLSIPIVTLCALVLLIIMVSLFDLFFRWLPYLFVCLPILGLRGKKNG